MRLIARIILIALAIIAALFAAAGLADPETRGLGIFFLLIAVGLLATVLWFAKEGQKPKKPSRAPKATNPQRSVASPPAPVRKEPDAPQPQRRAGRHLAPGVDPEPEFLPESVRLEPVYEEPAPEPALQKKQGYFAKAWAEADAEQKRIEQRKKENRENGIACCPKCGSASLTANKKGFGVGKAVVGAWAVGGLGLMAGNINSKKITITCLNCGYQFKPGAKK